MSTLVGLGSGAALAPASAFPGRTGEQSLGTTPNCPKLTVELAPPGCLLPPARRQAGPPRRSWPSAGESAPEPGMSERRTRTRMSGGVGAERGNPPGDPYRWPVHGISRGGFRARQAKKAKPTTNKETEGANQRTFTSTTTTVSWTLPKSLWLTTRAPPLFSVATTTIMALTIDATTRATPSFCRIPVLIVSPYVKVSDGRQPPLTFDFSLSKSAASRSLHRLADRRKAVFGAR